MKRWLTKPHIAYRNGSWVVVTPDKTTNYFTWNALHFCERLNRDAHYLKIWRRQLGTA